MQRTNNMCGEEQVGEMSEESGRLMLACTKLLGEVKLVKFGKKSRFVGKV